MDKLHTLSKAEQIGLLNGLSADHKNKIRNECVRCEQRGMKKSDIIKKIKELLHPVLPLLSDVAVKEFIVPLLKKKFGSGVRLAGQRTSKPYGSGVRVAGSGVRVAGGGVRLAGSRR